MTRNPGSRRFNDDEFALILRKAAELQSEGVRGGSSTEGFSLAEIEEIAAEAGIDPSRIREAAALVAVGGSNEGAWERVAGGPWSFTREHTLEGTVAQEDLGKLLDVIRREARAQGEVEHVLDSLEWSDKSDGGRLHVNVIPRSGNTVIQVMADRKDEAGVVLFIGPFLGAMAGIVLAKNLEFGQSLASLATFLAATGVGTAGARSFWHYHSRRWREKTHRLLERVTGTARELAAPPDDVESPEGPPQESALPGGKER